MGKLNIWSKKPLILFIVVSLLLGMNVTHAEPGSLDLDVKSAILMDAESGQILYEKNGNEALPPASMTKMMTAYLVLEAIQEGKLSWEDSVKISEYAFFLAKMPGASVVYLAQGSEYSVRDLFDAMEIFSANDATAALAEKVGTTEQLFVGMMNEKAKELGMTDTFFVNSTGLATKDLGPYGEWAQAEDNLMSARDLAILARALVNDFPEVLEVSSIAKKEFPNKVLMRNWNLMVPGRDSRYSYDGLDGLKTGHTSTAKWCFTATAKRGDLRLISVVMGAPKEAARFNETRKLLDYGFNNFEFANVVKGKDPVPGAEQASVVKGVELTVPVVAEKSLGLAVRRGEIDQYSFKAEWDAEALVAPIKAGQPVGTAKLFYKDQEVGLSVPLIAQENVEKAGWFRLVFRAIGDWIGSIFTGVKNIF